MKLLAAREPIQKIIEDTDRDPALRGRLEHVLLARNFAVGHLKLPDNNSYLEYADLGRPYALWNVLATPEFSLTPIESCFPIAGCVAYRGYYQKQRAEAQARRYRAEGYDVEIGGVPAFSTLGWFDDPILNTMMHWSDAVLIGTVFHELAHQQLYVKDDTAFNESFARFVEQEGLRQYLSRGVPDALQDEERRRRNRQFTELVLDIRSQLELLYAMPLAADAMRARKQDIFQKLKLNYDELRKSSWNNENDYGAWMAQDLNNASLLPFGLYEEWVPAFAALFESSERDWTRFYQACKLLGETEKLQRHQQIEQLMQASSH